MVSVYSYDKALEILDLFVRNQIIELNIYPSNFYDEDNYVIVFDYKTLEDYTEEEKINIRSEFNEKKLQLVNQTLFILNEFVSMMEIDNVEHFRLSFNILKNTFHYSKKYKKPLKSIEKIDVNETYQEFINNFEKFLTQNGVHKMNVPGLLQKTSSGKQRGIKNTPITFGQLVCKLKDVIIDNGNSEVINK